MPRPRKTPDMLQLEESDPHGRPIEDLMRDARLHYGSKYQAALALGISYNTYLKWEYVLKVQYPAQRRVTSQPIPRPTIAPPLLPAPAPILVEATDDSMDKPGFTPPPVPSDAPRFIVNEAYAQQVADMVSSGRITEDEADERLADPIPRPWPPELPGLPEASLPEPEPKFEAVDDEAYEGISEAEAYRRLTRPIPPSRPAVPPVKPAVPPPPKPAPEPEKDDLDARMEQAWLRKMASY